MIYTNNFESLREKLGHKRKRVLERYEYYDMKKNELDRGITIDPKLKRMYQSTLGWTGKAVDVLADRLIFREFQNDDFKMNEIFQMNNPDTLYDSAILSALISSCCFVYITKGVEDVPRLQVIEGSEATGIIDPITGLLKEGYAVLERNEFGDPIVEAHFLPKLTRIYYKNGDKHIDYRHNVEYPLLVPIIHRPDAVRPFGRSRISRAATYFQSYAKRVLERSEVTAEFYSFPQKYIVGLSEKAEPLDVEQKWRATVSSMLMFTKDEDGDKPTLGQFTTSSIQPFVDQLKMAASGFAGETGLTLDDLGFVTDNPSSAEAIKASHETLRLAAKKAQRNFGSGFLNVGYLAVCLRDNQGYKRSQFYNVKPKWENIFEPDMSTLSSIGDAVLKINQAIPGYMNAETMRDLTGIEGE